MEVRQEHSVYTRGRLRHGTVAPEVGDPATQNRIGEQAGAPELYEHGGVAQPGDARRGSYAAAPRLSSAAWSAVSCSLESEL
jgi:hypothetical protein